MSKEITGGCHCGSVKYRANTGACKTIAHCYCKMCRKLTGGTYVSYVEVPAKNFLFIEGQPKTVKSSSFAERSFCGDCGCHFTYRYYDERDEITENIWIVVGSIDRPEDLVPTDVIYSPCKLPWLLKDNHLAHWPGQMPWLRPGIEADDETS